MPRCFAKSALFPAKAKKTKNLSSILGEMSANGLLRQTAPRKPWVPVPIAPAIPNRNTTRLTRPTPASASSTLPRLRSRQHLLQLVPSRSQPSPRPGRVVRNGRHSQNHNPRHNQKISPLPKRPNRPTLHQRQKHRVQLRKRRTRHRIRNLRHQRQMLNLRHQLRILAKRLNRRRTRRKLPTRIPNERRHPTRLALVRTPPFRLTFSHDPAIYAYITHQSAAPPRPR